MGFSIGKCKFDGNKPTKSLTSGLIIIYHNGSVKKTGTTGGKSVWKGDGDVCVIFKKADEVDKHIFKITGNLQTCNNF